MQKLFLRSNLNLPWCKWGFDFSEEEVLLTAHVREINQCSCLTWLSHIMGQMDVAITGFSFINKCLSCLVLNNFGSYAFFQSLVTYMRPLFSSEKITMKLCGLFLTTHLNTTSNYSNHSMKTACLEMQKGTAISFLLICTKTFFVLSKMGSISHFQLPLDLNLSCPVCKPYRCGLDRQEESLGNRDGSPVPVHGFGPGSQPHRKQVGDAGGARDLLTTCWYTQLKKPEGPTKNPRCQSYCVTCRVF